MTTKEELVMSVKEWIKADNEIRLLQAEIKKRRLQKNRLSETLVDVMKNNDGSPNTAHTTNPVPIIVIDSKTDKVNDGILADIAPTILNIMDIDIPEKMSGKILI